MMRIRSNFICSVTSVVAIALFAGGCAMQSAGEEGNDTAKLEGEDNAAAFEFAPEEAEVLDKQLEEEDALNAKTTGAWATNVNRGIVFNAPVTVAQNQTITCETSKSGDKEMDTAMALLRRDDGYTGFTNVPSYYHMARFSTMVQDDDSGSELFSKISWTSRGGETNYQLIVWGYGESKGQANVTCTWSNPGNSQTWSDQPVTAGSLKWNTCDQGRAYTTGGGDPALFVVDKTAGGGNGYWNDDKYDGTYESELTSLTNDDVWFIVGRSSGADGTNTVNCQY